jgi:hypothetical protein
MWTRLKAKLKSSGDEASPCLKSLCIGKLPDKYLPPRTLLHVSFKLILISLTSCMGIPDSTRILHNLIINNQNAHGTFKCFLAVVLFLKIFVCFLNLLHSLYRPHSSYSPLPDDPNKKLLAVQLSSASLILTPLGPSVLMTQFRDTLT